MPSSERVAISRVVDASAVTVFGIVTDPAAAGRGDHVVRPAFRRLGVVDGDQAGHPLPVRLLPG